MEEVETSTTEPRTKVLKNGAVYDLDKKKIVSGALLTSDEASKLVKRREELKAERVAAGAAKFLENTGQWTMPTDLDVVEAISEQVMERAMDTDPKNSAQIKAADWIMENMGFTQSREHARGETPAGSITATPAALGALLEEIQRVQAAAVERARAVDATESENTDG